MKKSNIRIACIGGGTGLSTMLRGLKKYTSDVTAIVSVSDDGGGSGILRRELGMLPPGDIRNCIQALADDELLMTNLLGYRFTEGSLSGQSFGNLLLAAMNGVSGSFDEAVARTSEVLAITGRVLPVTNEDTVLEAVLEDGTVVSGESSICDVKLNHNCRIKGVRLVPEHPAPLKDSIEALERAELIVLGPGSLYTSVMPNLLVDGIADAIRRSRAPKVYVCNIMTQPGETDGYSVSDHLRVIFEHAGAGLVDCCLINNAIHTQDVIEKYAARGAETVMHREGDELFGVEAVFAPTGSNREKLARHDPDRLANAIIGLYRERVDTKVYGG